MRNIRLDMGYESMWSLVDEVTDLELREERMKLNNEIRERNKKISELNTEQHTRERKVEALTEILKDRKRIYTATNLIITDDHRKLLSKIDFTANDFKTYFRYHEIAQILGWKLPNEDLSIEQREKAEQLIYELPFVLNILNK
jgi:uncharacterized coiled-coil DUF342 family protein